MSDMLAESLPLHRFTVDDFERLAEQGLLGDRDHIELLDGLIVPLPPIGFEHARSTGRVLVTLTQAFGSAAVAIGPVSLRLGPHDMPEPDVAVLAPRRYTSTAPPGPADVYALIEVCITSDRRDLEIKRRLYARAGIADYLVVDVARGRLVHFSGPSGGNYPDPRIVIPGETLAIAAAPGIVLEAAPLLATG